MTSLTPKEKILAQYIIEDPLKTVEMSIVELAQSCGVSVSTVVRLCKSAGYNGYKAFCRDLSVDMAYAKSASVEYGDVLPGSPVETIIKAVCANDIKAIKNTQGVLDSESVEKAVNAIIAAPRVDFYAVGATGYVAMDAYRKFARIGKISMSSMDAPQMVNHASHLKPGDVAMIICYSGARKDVMECAEAVKDSGATLISLTKYSDNSLAKMADIRLYSSVADDAIVRSGRKSLRIGQLVVVDILYTAVVSGQYKRVKPLLENADRIEQRRHAKN